MKVSVVIPVFNNEATVGAALESVFAQRFDRPFEVIVVNDGSTDGTGMELKKFRDRIRVIEQNRRGVAGARNVGINAAVGEYIALLDADDAWTDDKLAKTVPVLDQNPSSVAVFSDAWVMEEPGRFLLPNYVTAGYDHTPTLDELLNPASWPILPTTIVARRDMMIAIGGFPEQFAASDYGCEDTFAFLLMRERGEITFVSEKLAWYRMPNWEQKLTKRLGRIRSNGDGKFRSGFEDPFEYFRGNRVFARLMRERFGVRGHGLAGKVVDGAAQELAMMGMKAMHEGDRGYARKCYIASLRHRRLWLKTWFRLGWATLPRAVSHRISPVLPPGLRRSLSGPPFLEERTQ